MDLKIITIKAFFLWFAYTRNAASLECYVCTNSTNINQCNDVIKCRTGQSCFHGLSTVGLSQMYSLGCIDKHQCGTHRGVATGFVGRGLQGQNNDCHECCSSDRCNKPLCEHFKPSACIDDHKIDCAYLNTVTNVCSDTQHARIICPRFCDLCNLVDGNWSEWSTWFSCSNTCGNGKQTRIRTCTNPSPISGGLNCSGNGTDVKYCRIQPCPVSITSVPLTTMPQTPKTQVTEKETTTAQTTSVVSILQNPTTTKTTTISTAFTTTEALTTESTTVTGPSTLPTTQAQTTKMMPTTASTTTTMPFTQTTTTTVATSIATTRLSTSPTSRTTTTASAKGTSTLPTTTTTKLTMTTLQMTTQKTSFLKGHVELCPQRIQQLAQTRGELLAQFEQSCYEIVESGVSWSHAEAICKGHDGHLIHIADQQEQDFIFDFLVKHNNHTVWLGLHDRNTEESFEWTSGNAVTFENWKPGRKDYRYHNSEDCVFMTPTTGEWDDIQCGGDNGLSELIQGIRHAFICQYATVTPLNPLNATINGNINLCPHRLQLQAQKDRGTLAQHDQSCYELVPNSKVSWQYAEQICSSRGGHLVFITSSQEQNFIQGFMKSHFPDHAVWIGLTDRNTEGRFDWESGQNAQYTNWVPGHIANYASSSQEDCVVLIPYKNGQWDDIPCGHTHHSLFGGTSHSGDTHPFLCEYSISTGPSLIG